MGLFYAIPQTNRKLQGLAMNHGIFVMLVCLIVKSSPVNSGPWKNTINTLNKLRGSSHEEESRNRAIPGDFGDDGGGDPLSASSPLMA